MQTNREARCGTGALWKMHAVEDESRIKRRSWRQGTIKVQKGTKEKQGKRSRPFFFQSHFFLSLCHFTHQYFESVCVCVCVCARARACVCPCWCCSYFFVSLWGFLKWFMFRALEAIFTVPPTRPCSLLLPNSLLALDEKAPFVPLNAGLKPSQAIFVMYIFYHSEKHTTIW